MMKEMAENLIYQKELFKTHSLHLLLDAVLSDILSISKSCLDFLMKLLKFNRTNVYIPGKTLSGEKQKQVLMIHGFILVLLNMTLNCRDESLQNMSEQYIKQYCNLKELCWNLKMIDSFLAAIPEKNKIYKSANGLPYITQSNLLYESINSDNELNISPESVNKTILVEDKIKKKNLYWIENLN